MLARQNRIANFHTDADLNTAARECSLARGCSAASGSSEISVSNGAGSTNHTTVPITAPTIATSQNASRHPTAMRTGAMISGAMPGPRLLAPSMKPIAVALVFGRVRSAKALNDAAGKSPWLMPNIARMTISEMSPHANPVNAVNTDHRIKATINSGLGPKRSANIPPGTCPSM